MNIHTSNVNADDGWLVWFYSVAIIHTLAVPPTTQTLPSTTQNTRQLYVQLINKQVHQFTTHTHTHDDQALVHSWCVMVFFSCLIYFANDFWLLSQLPERERACTTIPAVFALSQYNILRCAMRCN